MFVGEIFNHYYGLKDVGAAESKNPFLREREGALSAKVAALRLNSGVMDDPGPEEEKKNAIRPTTPKKSADCKYFFMFEFSLNLQMLFSRRRSEEADVIWVRQGKAILAGGGSGSR